MKKLILSVFAVIGLAGSEIQGAAQFAKFGAQARIFGAKAMNLLNVAAMPVAVGGAGLAINKLSDNVGEIGQGAHKAVDGLSQKLDGAVGQLGVTNTAILSLLTSPKVMKFLGLESKEKPTTWYGKVWNNLCYFDDVTDSLLGKFQKYVALYSAMQALTRSAQPQESQVTQPTQEEIDAYVASQQAVVQNQSAQNGSPRGRADGRSAWRRRA